MANTDLIMRHKKVAYMDVGVEGTPSIGRMSGFTSMGTNRNATEHTRKYVDEAHETTDITAINTSIGFSFEYYKGNPVHEKLIDIIDNEKTGEDAIVDIYTVDFTKPIGQDTNKFACAHRLMAVVPSSDGDDSNVYTYNGDFRTKGDRVTGTATVSEDGQTITYAED